MLPAFAADTVVGAGANSWDPDEFAVKPGEQVTWTNASGVVHNLSVNGTKVQGDGASWTYGPQTYAARTQPYEYHCTPPFRDERPLLRQRQRDRAYAPAVAEPQPAAVAYAHTVSDTGRRRIGGGGSRWHAAPQRRGQPRQVIQGAHDQAALLHPPQRDRVRGRACSSGSRSARPIRCALRGTLRRGSRRVRAVSLRVRPGSRRVRLPGPAAQARELCVDAPRRRHHASRALRRPAFLSAGRVHN